MSSENEAFLAAKQSYGYWRAGDAALLGSRNPLRAETVATRPAARVQRAAARGSSHCKKTRLESLAHLCRGKLPVISSFFQELYLKWQNDD